MKTSELQALLNGLELVAKAFFRLNKKELDKIVKNSSLNSFAKSSATTLEEKLSSMLACAGKPNTLPNLAKEISERGEVVAKSILQYSAILARQSPIASKFENPANFDISDPIIEENEFWDVQKQGVTEKHLENNEIKKEILRADQERKGKAEDVSILTKENQIKMIQPKHHTIAKLSERARERKVPSSQISRVFEYSSLVAAVSLNAATEFAKRKLLAKDAKDSEKAAALLSDNPFLTEASANKIVDTLCKVRGAALKLGQMLSIQDNAMINPQLAAIFERVRQSADFMPAWQMRRVLDASLDDSTEGFWGKKRK